MKDFNYLDYARNQVNQKAKGFGHKSRAERLTRIAEDWRAAYFGIRSSVDNERASHRLTMLELSNAEQELMDVKSHRNSAYVLLAIVIVVSFLV